MPASEIPLPASLAPGRGDITERQLLHSIVEVARQAFGSAAASVFLADSETGELVFEAVCGEGEAELPGTRFPAGTGIAGWVAASGQPMIADDLDQDATFDRSAAESTGYVPRSVMAAPLIRSGECLGVLEVLDRDLELRDELADMALLGMLATQGALALELLLRLHGRGSDAGLPVGAGATASAGGSAALNDAVMRLLAAADELREGSRGGR